MKKMSDELIQNHTEITKLNSELSMMSAKIRDLEKAKTDFISNLKVISLI